ncbi:MAG TPA: FMN-dependent NADH-azoreductase [Colwellia sp.]|nr:FMN-dependent NADH-azoreductase [Colwellia sp.]
MNNILFIKSSLNGEQGQSNKLAQQLVSNLASTSNITIIERDLAKQSLPHLSQAEMSAWMTQPNERSDKEEKLANVSDTLIEELHTSDTIVIGMPMYNFGVPSTFKAWVDRVARAGITFSYTENGPIGLLEDKKVIVVAARGGIYAGLEKDTQTQFLKDFFSFIGIDDISFIYAEGLNMSGSDQRLEAAQAVIDNFTN